MDTIPYARPEHFLSVRVQSWHVALGSDETQVESAPHRSHYRLVPVPFAPALRASAADWPSNDLFLVSHRALREVPRVRALWDMLVERAATRAKTKK